MRPLKLQSCLAKPIENFINLRRLSGTDYKSQAQLLGYFDRFLLGQKWNSPSITPEIIDCYQQSLSHLAPRTSSNRFCVVRQLCQYLTRGDHLCYVPEAIKNISSKGSRQPYIYTRYEIKRIMKEASDLNPPKSLRPHTYKTLIGVLYSTGIRISEALALNLEHFYINDRLFYIAEGKFRKARWVPLSVSTCHALDQYLHKRLQIRPNSPDSALFINQRFRRLHQCTVNQTFHKLLRQCSIHHDKQKGPRIHDFRHTFAVHRLLAWYRDGQDVNARLPALSTYMGHVDIHSTQIYLQATTELIEQVNLRFHNHYLYQVKNNGGKNDPFTRQVYKTFL